MVGCIAIGSGCNCVRSYSRRFDEIDLNAVWNLIALLKPFRECLEAVASASALRAEGVRPILLGEVVLWCHKLQTHLDKFPERLTEQVPDLLDS